MWVFLALLGIFFFFNGFYFAVILTVLGQWVAGAWGAVIGWIVGYHIDSSTGTIK